MLLTELTPYIGSRSIIVGKTGEGKSVLLRYLTSQLNQPFTIVIDPKGEFETNGVVVNTLDDINNAKSNRLIYRPDIDSNIVADVDTILRAVYRMGNCTLIIDELYGIQENNNYPPALNAIYTRGRSKKITVIAASQRPRFIPRYCISECENHYIFRTNLPDDRKYLGSIVGQEVINRPDKYHFWYSSTDREIEPTICTLKLT